MGILIFAYMELQFQKPNSTTLSKKKSIFQSLSDRSNMIENSENRKKLFLGLDLIDDRLIEKKKSTALITLKIVAMVV